MDGSITTLMTGTGGKRKVGRGLAGPFAEGGCWPWPMMSKPGGPHRGTGWLRRRRALGLTQEELAALLDIDRSTVVRWERGATQPLPWIRPKVAKVLQIPVGQLDELLGGPLCPA